MDIWKLDIAEMIEMTCKQLGIENWQFGSHQQGSDARGILFFVLHAKGLTDRELSDRFRMALPSITQARNKILKEYRKHEKDIEVLKEKIKIEEIKHD